MAAHFPRSQAPLGDAPSAKFGTSGTHRLFALPGPPEHTVSDRSTRLSFFVLTTAVVVV